MTNAEIGEKALKEMNGIGGRGSTFNFFCYDAKIDTKIV